MEERLAFSVSTIQELEGHLESFLREEINASSLLRGSATKDEVMTLFGADDDICSAIESWMKKRKHDELMTLWVKGYNIDWRGLYGDEKLSKIPLPSYSFARGRYWVSTEKSFSYPAIGATNDYQKNSGIFADDSGSGIDGHVFNFEWVAADNVNSDNTVCYQRRIVIFCGQYDDISLTQYVAPYTDAEYIFLKKTGDSVDDYSRFSQYIFLKIKEVLLGKPTENVLLQIVNFTLLENRFFLGLSALLKTAHQENPKIFGQYIAFSRSYLTRISVDKVLTILSCEQNSGDCEICHSEHTRRVRKYAYIEPSQTKVLTDLPWKRSGIYLITGGAGGLGMIFAKEIAEKAREVVLVLTGRSELSAEKISEINALENMTGARVDYQRVDMAKSESVNALIQRVEEKYRALNGIIHSAGIIRDNFIIFKSEEEFQSVLSPKVAGLRNIDEASKHLDMDFLVIFSSTAGARGNSGQADYSTANAFMDEYAAYRNALVKDNKRNGISLSINWPFWEEGGMRMEEEAKKQFLSSVGLIPMTNATGIGLFYRGLNSGREQIIVFEGAGQLIKQHLLDSDRNQPTSDLKMVANADSGTSQTGDGASPLLEENISNKLKKIFGDVIKLEPSRIDSSDTFDSYGTDSTMITQLNQQLSEFFKDLSKTVLYEYQSLDDLTRYLLSEHRQQCIGWDGLHASSPLTTEPSSVENNSGGIELRKSRAKHFNTPDHHILTEKPERQQQAKVVAIIGMSGRFAGAHTLQEFWQNLKMGRTSITEIQEERWPLADFYHPDRDLAVSVGKSYSKWGGFLDDFANFDPVFFSIPPSEAMGMDPQERLFLEESWKALEDAGYAPSTLSAKLRRRTAVFGGITKQGFNLHQLKNGEGICTTSFSSCVNRVSHCFNLQGPSFPIDTMCSSALVALHEGCEYIRHGRGNLAVVGGVDLYLHPMTYRVLSSNRLVADGAESKVFAEGGVGFVPGEGVGVVLLKSFEAAKTDGDNIYALIRGTAVNHSGKTNGYMMPAPNQQVAVMREALAQQNIDPRSIAYFESAATGSETADAIEMSAVTQVFGDLNHSSAVYTLGSLKPNIGHCESAAGMAQLMKVVYSLKHQTFAPTVFSGTANPHIDFERLPFKLRSEASIWPPLMVDGWEVPRRAAIHNNGAGGVNAHIIVEEYLAETPVKKAIPPQGIAFLISVKSRDSIVAYLERWHDYVLQNEEMDLVDLCYTMQLGREAMSYRLALVVNTREKLLQGLAKWQAGVSTTPEELSKFPGIYMGNTREGRALDVPAVATALSHHDMNALAKLWVSGNEIDWSLLYAQKKPRRLNKLPSYPFKSKSYWLYKSREDGKVIPLELPSEKVDSEPEAVSSFANKAEEFYTAGVSPIQDHFQEEYLTFCPFEEKIPSFSMTRVFLDPQTYAEEFELLLDKQRELRQVLFCREDLSQVSRLLDFGCGHGTDVIQIGALYPEIETHGYTIARSQAELGQKRIRQLGLQERVKIFHKNSARNPFLSQYDIILGVEVTFHIREKASLFRNICQALVADGRVLLMDFIANLRGPIVDPDVEISIPTQEGWVELLSEHGLLIDEIIDVSEQIANFLHDPNFAHNTQNLSEVQRNTFRNYANQSLSLEEGWISYCLLKLRKAPQYSQSELALINTDKMEGKKPYAQAFREMRETAQTPYPDKKALHRYFKNDFENVAHLETDKDSHANDIIPATSVSKQNLSHEVESLEVVPDVLEQLLSEIFCQVLKLDRNELEEVGSFSELGLSSIHAVRILEAINTRFDTALPTSVVFEFNTIHSLASYIASHLPRNVIANTETSKPPSSALSDTPDKPVYAPLNQNLERSELMNAEQHHYQGYKNLAIIGLACRSAGARNAEEFWQLIAEGRDCIREVSRPEWLAYFRYKNLNKPTVRYGIMDDVQEFDPLFFRISPVEAASMDVTQRIILEESYKALQDAAYPPSSLQGKPVGVFIGTMGTDTSIEDFSLFRLLGIDTSIVAARIAYYLDLKGPALAVNTACSSSMVALDIACQKLTLGEIDMAVVGGGVTIYTHPSTFVSMSNASMLSPTGQCRPFDNAANGLLVGDGAGVVIVKRLRDAEQDQDRIYGVIRGGGVNQDGQTSGISVPSFLSQSQLQQSVYRRSGIRVDDLQYIEAHGTATNLGDPVEVHALSESFGQFTQRKQFCAIGSLKANIGHTTAAAGVLGLIKILKSLQHEQLPPSINFSQENHNIDFADSPVYVNTALKAWPLNSQGSRLSAINSFGISGTNTHFVIEQYRSKSPQRKAEKSDLILPLSARSEERLVAYVSLMREFLLRAEDVDLMDMAYTLQLGQDVMSHRLVIVVDSAIVDAKAHVVLAFQAYEQGELLPGVWSSHAEEGAAKNRLQPPLVESWLQGKATDWLSLYPQQRPRKISLPAYPFERDKFAVSHIEIPQTSEASGGGLKQNIAIARENIMWSFCCVPY